MILIDLLFLSCGYLLLYVLQFRAVSYMRPKFEDTRMKNKIGQNTYVFFKKIKYAYDICSSVVGPRRLSRSCINVQNS